MTTLRRSLLLSLLLATTPVLADDVTYVGRVGLFGTPEFTSNTGYQFSHAENLTDSGWLAGFSNRYNDTSSYLGAATWVAVASTGQTYRVGLYDQSGGNEFTRATGYQSSSVQQWTESGWLTGTSERYHGGVGWWVAAASTGQTYRIGLYDQGGGNEFTRSDGFQSNFNTRLTESGWVAGYAQRYGGGSSSLGDGVWVAAASTGQTYRIGLYDMGGGNEFTRSDGIQNSVLLDLTASGWVSGQSNRFDGSSFIGVGAWVATTSTGATTRLGFYDQGGGNQFTRSDGYQYSSILQLNEVGWLTGYSQRYDGGGSPVAIWAWVATASGGSPTRVGFYDEGGGNEFTRNDGYQFSYADQLTESGWLTGFSERFNGGSTSRGSAAWVATVGGGGPTRVGFYDEGGGNEFTRDDGFQSSGAARLTESGWLSGLSERYNGGSSALGIAAWVRGGTTGPTYRIGLYDQSGGNQFTSNNGRQSSFADHLTESGWLAGSSERYNGGSSSLGSAVWAAGASTGQTYRLGLYDQGGGNEFTRNDGTQYSTVHSLTESGWLAGSSQRHNGGGSNLGYGVWVAEASTGVTTQVGLFDAAHTRNDGYRRSLAYGLTEAGLAFGISERYHGDSLQDGQTAWIYDLTSDTQIVFVLSVRPSDGYAGSDILGITSDGLAYGFYQLFSGETYLGSRPFVWSELLGVQTIEEEIAGGIAQYGWTDFIDATHGSGGGYVVGRGHLAGVVDSQGVYLVQAPEPGSAALLMLGVGLLGARRRSSCK